MNEITLKQSAALREAFLKDPGKKLRMNATTKSGIDAVSRSFAAPVDTPNVFSTQIRDGDVTDQMSSGRCWLFASCNVMRLEVMKACDLKTFELSQSYLFFWDKFEKANFFLESIIDTVNEPLDGRLLDWLLDAPFNDGGQWDMVVALVEKYGVVPKAVYPESWHSSHSAVMDRWLTLKGRECAKTLRDAAKAGEGRDKLEARKQDMLAVFYNMLCICLGVPPLTFDFEVRGKEHDDDKSKSAFVGGKFTRDLGITPLDFYHKYVGKKLDEYVSLINSPTADKPFFRTYTVSYLGNVVGGRPVLYLNLPVENLKRMALAQLKDGEVVWFGSDVGQWSEREHGLLDPAVSDVAGLFETSFPLDKAARLDYNESQMTHAMVLTGVNEIDGVPNRWKVENSCGDDSGEKGAYSMSDALFNEYVYQIVVNKKYLTREEQAALEKKPVVLKPWDPMGSLA
jgi:bleomycin hydrolase